VRCPWLLAEMKVVTILGNYSSCCCCYHPYSKPQKAEGVVVGFQIFAWDPNKNNTNSVKQKFDPPPLSPWGDF
jgi:hypothetical protein